MGLPPSNLGLYVHIPFCRSKCDYCDFYSLSNCDGLMDHYQTALLSHIREAAPFTQSYQVNTLYFGGGTPSYYGEKRLAQLLKTCRKVFPFAKNPEITVECNPDSVNLKMLKTLRKSGVNRISMGMQSAQNVELQNLHRPHTFEQVQQAVCAVRQAGIQNLSLDLMFGLPNQTPSNWKYNLEQAIALQPEHISCYGLTLEENTPLYHRVQSGLSIPDDDQQADFYLDAVNTLAQAGYEQYEISNFAKPEFRCRHNMKYWMGKEYMGFGPAAHSDFGGCRYAILRNLPEYIRLVKEGGQFLSECEHIRPQERAGEYIMLRLRTSYGVEASEYTQLYHRSFDLLENKLREYEEHGWAVRNGIRWRFTPEGFLLSNQLIGELLDIQTIL